VGPDARGVTEPSPAPGAAATVAVRPGWDARVPGTGGATVAPGVVVVGGHARALCVSGVAVGVAWLARPAAGGVRPAAGVRITDGGRVFPSSTIARPDLTGWGGDAVPTTVVRVPRPDLGIACTGEGRPGGGGAGEGVGVVAGIAVARARGATAAPADPPAGARGDARRRVRPPGMHGLKMF